jgi:hypothetical protein
VLANFTRNDPNYTNASGQTTFTISQPAVTVVVTDNGGTYNGSPFPATATVNGGSTLDGVGLTLSYYSGTYTSVAQLSGQTPLAGAPGTAGSYTVEATFPGNTDYSSASVLANFTISQATPIVSVTDNGGTYNGSSFPATDSVAGVNGVPGSTLEGVGLTLTYYSGTYRSAARLTGLTPLSGAPSMAGSYTVEASFAGSTGYSSANALANFAITPVLANPGTQNNWQDGTTEPSASSGNISVVLSGTTIDVYGTHTYTTASGYTPQVTLSDSLQSAVSTALTKLNVAVDATSQTAASPGSAAKNSNGKYTSTLTVTNTSSSTINGTLEVVLQGLTSALTGAQLKVGSKVYNLTSLLTQDSQGDYVITIPKADQASLTAGGSLLFTLTTTAAPNAYTTKVFSSPYS